MTGDITMRSPDDTPPQDILESGRLHRANVWIPPWWYWHPRALARAHLAAGTFLVGLGVVSLAGGLPWVAALVLPFAAVHFGLGYALTTFSRWAPPRRGPAGSLLAGLPGATAT
jgi:hypothetical protein